MLICKKGRQRISSAHRLYFTSFLHLPGTSEEVAPPLQHNFMIPKKEINVVSDMAKWKRSQVWLWGSGRC